MDLSQVAGLDGFPLGFRSHPVSDSFMWLALRLLPIFARFAAWWVESQERKILREGVPLSPAGLADASRMGVEYPEKIRLMRVARIPLLNSDFMKLLSRWVPSISSNTVGLTLRYGIYIRSEYWGSRRLIAHECVHIGQYERCGSITTFLARYFTECIEIGYPDGPMEQDAIMRPLSLDE